MHTEGLNRVQSIPCLDSLTPTLLSQGWASGPLQALIRQAEHTLQALGWEWAAFNGQDPAYGSNLQSCLLGDLPQT